MALERLEGRAVPEEVGLADRQLGGQPPELWILVRHLRQPSQVWLQRRICGIPEGVGQPALHVRHARIGKMESEAARDQGLRLPQRRR